MLGGGTQTNLPGPNKSKSQVCGICGPKQHLTVGYKRALWIVIALNIGYGIIEIIGGFLAGSQALKADALDFLGDGLITLLGVFAIGWSLLWRARSALIQGVFLGQTLGFTAHTLEMNAAYLHNWLRVLRSDKGAIFKHAADAQRACDYLIARSEVGRAGEGAQAA